jgi:hypothetical protein
MDFKSYSNSEIRVFLLSTIVLIDPTTKANTPQAMIIENVPKTISTGVAGEMSP